MHFHTKKNILIILLFLTFICVVSYGVYSYYWTRGNMNASGSISIESYDPRVENVFIGESGTGWVNSTITCPEYITEDTTIYCSASFVVSNNGGTPVFIEVFDEEAGFYYVSSELNANASKPTFNWSSKTLEPDESSTLNITIPISTSSSFNSSEAVRVYENVENPFLQVNYRFTIKSTQVHE